MMIAQLKESVTDDEKEIMGIDEYVEGDNIGRLFELENDEVCFENYIEPPWYIIPSINDREVILLPSLLNRERLYNIVCEN